ncbi:MAG: autotransporter outer membrane beta-barrel domain-containing protein, partial [Methylobacillus sp.]|jgi:outer membrane autotransporter protein|nr:autotransporter outer membrane beta-barrel domain-containing protein [Methylobacillus sp.]
MDNTNGGATLGLNTGNRTITFFDPVMNNAANGLITVTKTGEFGEVIFDGTNYANASDRWSKVYGETTVQAGTFTVRNNAVYGALEAEATGAAAGDSTFTVDQNATLAGGILGEVRADKITLNGNLNIAGSATPGNGGGGFSTFKLTGNSVNFGANSRILFNTYLNDAATQLTDLLVLDIKNGSAVTGTAGIFVTNVAGLAAAGVTQGDGIKVVQTDNGTTSGAFTLANPGGFVAVGPYAYTLRYKTVGGTGEDWFLTSALVDCNTNPNDPACATPNSGDVPNYNPATSLIAAAPGLALTYGSVLLGSLHERHPTRHDQHGVDDNACGQDQLSWAECQSSAFWARGLGGVGKRNGGSAGIYGNHGPTYDYDYIVGQLGVDLLRTEDASGNRNHFGAYYAYGQIEGDVGAVNWGYAGQTGMHGNSLGLYFTHFGAEGGYIDVVAQGTRYGVNARDHITGAYINTDGTGYAASLEGGLPFWSDGDQTWGIEPQAQLTYQHININSTHEKGVLPGNNTKVSFDDVKSLQGRVGVRLAHNWKDAPDAVGSGWLRLSLTNEFLAKPKTTFSSASDPVSFEARQTGTGVELRAGFDGWFSGVALFANLGASTGLSGQGHAFDGRMGVRVPF